jgi:serine/threonine protein kinase
MADSRKLRVGPGYNVPVSLAGRTISHYTIVEEISRGGMGVVYRATDTRLRRDVDNVQEATRKLQ